MVSITLHNNYQTSTVGFFPHHCSRFTAYMPTAATGTASEDLSVPLRASIAWDVGCQGIMAKILPLGCAGYVVVDNVYVYRLVCIIIL